MDKRNQVLFYIIILLPVIDMLTAFTQTAPVSVGILFRMAVMAGLFFYLIRYFRSKHPLYLLFFGLAFAAIGITFLLQWAIKEPFYVMEEIQFAFKTAYYVTMLFTVLALVRENIQRTVLLRATTIAALLVGTSYWLAFLTKTNISSYAYLKTGYAGWFFSANELSVIVLLLLGFTLTNLAQTKQFPAWLAVVLLVSMLPMIGTKTAFYGGTLLLVLYIAYVLLGGKRQKTDVALLTAALLYTMLLPWTPIMANSTSLYDETEAMEKTAEAAEQTGLLSSRDVYLTKTKQDFTEAPMSQKVFGMGYGGNYKKAAKTIEMDFYDLFFSYGFIGSFFLLLPLLFVMKTVYTFSVQFRYILPVVTLALCTGIAFVAGHVLFAPAVMSYIALLAIYAGMEGKTA